MTIDLGIPAHDPTDPTASPMRWILDGDVLSVVTRASADYREITGSEWAQTGGRWDLADLVDREYDAIPIDLGSRWMAYNVRAAVAAALASLQ